MNKFILGSGLVGLLARKILGSSYTVIPFYKSRFFSFNPPLDDNFIICNKEIDYGVRQIFGDIKRYPYRRRYSFNGEIVPFSKHVCENWIYKIFGIDIPGQVLPYYASQDDFEVYDLRSTNIYKELMEEYKTDIENGLKLGQLTNITGETLHFGTKQIPYSHIVNTLPLNAFCSLAGTRPSLRARTVQLLHVATQALNFEGNNQLLVADPKIDFYKVTNIAKDRYLFYFLDEQANPGIYLMPLIPGQFDIIDGTSIIDYIPMGSIPQVNFSQVDHIGSYAQWDFCVDIASCVLRLLKISSK